MIFSPNLSEFKTIFFLMEDFYQLKFMMDAFFWCSFFFLHYFSHWAIIWKSWLCLCYIRFVLDISCLSMSLFPFSRRYLFMKIPSELIPAYTPWTKYIIIWFDKKRQTTKDDRVKENGKITKRKCKMIPCAVKCRALCFSFIKKNKKNCQRIQTKPPSLILYTLYL